MSALAGFRKRSPGYFSSSTVWIAGGLCPQYILRPAGEAGII
jgi:hypothetical protein